MLPERRSAGVPPRPATGDDGQAPGPALPLPRPTAGTAPPCSRPAPGGLLFLACILVSLASAAAQAAGASEPLRKRVLVMGTWAEVRTFAADRSAGLHRLEKAVGILEDAEGELSDWREDSRIAQLNRWEVGQPFSLDDRLCELFRELFFWHARTDFLFDPGVGGLVRAWRMQGAGRPPAAQEWDALRRASGLRRLEFDPVGCSVVRRGGVVLDAGAFGKGAALDRLRRKWVEWAGDPLLADLGGQMAAVGAPPGATAWQAGVADPRRRDRELFAIRLGSGSLAVSGGSERDLTAPDGARIGHILDPRTGEPAGYRGSVAVWHESALAADILSTALFVMGPQQGLSWAAGLGLAVCYLTPADGAGQHPAVRVDATPEFRRRFFDGRSSPTPTREGSAGSAAGARPGGTARRPQLEGEDP